jgi:hypothetical protein
MDIELQAKSAIRETSRRLEELLEIALSEKRYRELGAVSSLAQAIAAIVQGFDIEGVVASHDGSKVHASASSDHPSTVEQLDPSSKKQKSESLSAPNPKIDVVFPQFRVDGDKLVKIGWSKKDKRTYEHRAPRDGVFQLAATLEARVRPGTPFKMEHFVPLQVGKGEELPTYQTYLALAWFRSLGIVEELGKMGYRFDEGALSKRRIQSYWTKLPKTTD